MINIQNYVINLLITFLQIKLDENMNRNLKPKIFALVSKFKRFLINIPFTVNKKTLQIFIEYYQFNWKIEGDIIINNDYTDW